MVQSKGCHSTTHRFSVQSKEIASPLILLSDLKALTKFSVLNAITSNLSRLLALQDQASVCFHPPEATLKYFHLDKDRQDIIQQTYISHLSIIAA